MENEESQNQRIPASAGEQSLDQQPLDQQTLDEQTLPAASSSADSNKKKKSRKKKASKKKTSKKKGLGSAKGIETMFRNAYRAELDLIALAAMKANIMISLNGFIVSALMISGGFIYASSPLFLAPATFFLFTSAVSIYFALLAASPEAISAHDGIINWLRDVIKRKAGIRDFKAYAKPDHSFIEGESNILIYADRVLLSKQDYLQRMFTLLKDQDDVYAKMSDQLYWFGQMASQKFKMLRASYGTFRWGLVISVLLLVAVRSFMFLMPATDNESTIHMRNAGISQFEGIYEPSAVQQLEDGRLLIVEDESARALRVVEFRPDGSISENRSLDNRLLSSFRSKLNDLEGATMSEDGYVYATTSHSRTKKGARVQTREQLVRFKIRGNDLIDSGVYTGLTDQLHKSGVFERALENSVNKNVSFQAINIEALTFDKRGKRLLVGFREPLIDGKSMIIAIENPAGIFERGEQPKFSKDVFLADLQGGGIRSLTYDPVMGVYLMVNEVRDAAGKNQFQLWSWSGAMTEQPKKVALRGMTGLRNVESIAPVIINGEAKLFIVSDDGDIKTNRPAKYMVLEYEQLLH